MMSHADADLQRRRMFRKATIAVGVLLLLVVIGVVMKQFGTVEQRETPTVERLVKQWAAAGLSTGQIEDLAKNPGAERAVTVDVGGGPVNVYHYNVENNAQFKKLEQIKADKSMMEGDEKVPALVNGSFVLTGYEDNPSKDDLVNTFNGFGTFEGIQPDVKTDEGK